MDYHVFILSRIRERCLQGVHHDEALAERHRGERGRGHQRGRHHGRGVLDLRDAVVCRRQDARGRPGRRGPDRRDRRARHPPAGGHRPARRAGLVPAALAGVAARPPARPGWKDRAGRRLAARAEAGPPLPAVAGAVNCSGPAGAARRPSGPGCRSGCPRRMSPRRRRRPGRAAAAPSAATAGRSGPADRHPAGQQRHPRDAQRRPPGPAGRRGRAAAVSKPPRERGQRQCRPAPGEGSSNGSTPSSSLVCTRNAVSGSRDTAAAIRAAVSPSAP